MNRANNRSRSSICSTRSPSSGELPLTNQALSSATLSPLPRGGVVTNPTTTETKDVPYVGEAEQDDLPRGEDGEVDYKLILSNLGGLRRRIDRAGDDLRLSRDRLDVISQQRRFAGIIDLGPSATRTISIG